MFKFLRSKSFRQRAAIFCLAFLTLCVIAGIACANQGLPWEGPLDKVQKSIRGPVAKAISFAGVVGSISALVFGGDIQGTVRSAIFLVLAISILMLAASFISGAGISEQESSLITLIPAVMK